MQAVFEMGVYGGYVWTAYAVSAAILAGLAVMIWRRSRLLSEKLGRADEIHARPDSGGGPDKNIR
ncbi:MAG TPA: heme exporter protein CcmD [Parvularculaceae bacterium]|nr:heme exporter protein CcmD [Parvularculaceae bacterium]HNS86336.1 heme exporter protein CcmD [Parvularculaceae bacterium]